MVQDEIMAGDPPAVYLEKIEGLVVVLLFSISSWYRLVFYILILKY
jgi:hypothetical protein